MDLKSQTSNLLNTAVEEFAKLPGIGKKTALRLVLHLLKQPAENIIYFSNSIINLRNNIKYCKKCNNISENDICSICSNPNRDQSTICIVQDIRDVISIENTNQFKGVYHVLGGIISPMDGIGPKELKIDNLENKLKEGNVQEIVFALSTTMEGETTNFYLFKKFSKYKVKITTIARGISFGDELEYADELTLGKSIINRTPFEATLTS